jgi:hypothetical protein
LKELFLNLPIKLSWYHQFAIIHRYTTWKAKTECDKELWKSVQELKAILKEEFRKKLIKFEIWVSTLIWVVCLNLPWSVSYSAKSFSIQNAI